MTAPPAGSRSPARRLTVLAAVAALLLLAPLAAWRLGGGEGETPRADGPAASSASSASPAGDPVARRTADGARVVRALTALLAGGPEAPSEDAVVDPRQPRAREQVRSLAATLRAWDARGLSARFVAVDPAASGAGSEWVGTVEVRVRIPGQGPVAFTTAMRFRETSAGTRFAGTGAALAEQSGATVGATPTWWSEPLAFGRTGRVVALAPTRGAVERLLTQGRRAVQEVRRVLPGWDGRLVLELPGSQVTTENALGAAPGSYAGIAAVTTTRTRDGRGPAYVLLNPAVWSGLGPAAAQVVVTHEAVHVARGATATAAPLWLVEGFADYVALRDVPVPPRRSAAAYLQRVRTEGLPTALPTEADFDARTSGLGATYEAAWLLARTIARAAGEGALVAFADAVDAGTPVTAALRDEVGLTERALLRRWRSDVRRLAGLTG